MSINQYPYSHEEADQRHRASALIREQIRQQSAVCYYRAATLHRGKIFAASRQYIHCGFITPTETLDLSLIDSSVDVRITNLTGHRIVFGIKLNGEVVLSNHNFTCEKTVPQNERAVEVFPERLANVALNALLDVSGEYYKAGIRDYCALYGFLHDTLVITPKTFP